MLELTDRRVLLGHGLQRDTFIKAGASHRRARVLWANWGSGPARATPPDAPHPPPRHLVPLRRALRATLRLSGPAACSRSGEACFKDLWEKKETGGDHRPGPRCTQGWAVQTPGRPHARLPASAVSAGRGWPWALPLRSPDSTAVAGPTQTLVQFSSTGRWSPLWPRDKCYSEQTCRRSEKQKCHENLLETQGRPRLAPPLRPNGRGRARGSRTPHGGSQKAKVSRAEAARRRARALPLN